MIGRVDSVFLGDGAPDILIIQRDPDNKAEYPQPLHLS